MDFGDLAGWGGLIASITALVAAFSARRRIPAQNRVDDAGASEQISTAWEKLIQPYREELATLRKDVNLLKRQNLILRKRERILWDYIMALKTRLKENNIEAPPMPDLPTLTVKDLETDDLEAVKEDGNGSEF